MNSRNALIRLNAIPDIGSITIRRLVDAFGSAELVFSAQEAALRQVAGRQGTPEVLKAIRDSRPEEATLELERAAAAGVEIVTWVDADYPELLKNISDPPPVLYVRGTLFKEDAAAVAIVGTRSATPYGMETARRLAEELVRCGVTVVSGLAEGIDRAAHEGALKAGGRTIAVLGHGLSLVYPTHHRELAERITRSGCLLSEFPMGEPPNAWNFPKRNRIISGLSLGVVVVEAPVRSGALITAREAMEQGREVFAVPGPISARTQGTHRLIRDGAKLVEQAADILQEVAPQLRDHVTQWQSDEACDRVRALSADEARVFESIPVGTPAGLDALVGKLALQPKRLMAVLTELEIKGLVRRDLGRGYTRAR